jgi:hypothetical protein
VFVVTQSLNFSQGLDPRPHAACFFPFKVHILLQVSSLIITLFAFDHQYLISMSHHDHIDTVRSNIWEEDCQPSVRIIFFGQFALICFVKVFVRAFSDFAGKA